jgi:hypothetical protein
MAETLVEDVEAALDRLDEPGAAGIVIVEPRAQVVADPDDPGQPLADLPRRLAADRVERDPRLIDARQQRIGLDVDPVAGGIERRGGPVERGIDRRPERRGPCLDRTCSGHHRRLDPGEQPRH